MSKIQVNEIVNHFDTGAPDCPKGLTVTGFSTFTGSSSFSGNVSIGGTLTYEDVTNIDSVGIITGRNGMYITSGDVGIGTDNPSAKLDVRGNDIRHQGTNPYIEFYQTDGTNTGYIQSRAAAGGDFRFNSVGSIPVTFGTNDTERVRITTGGDVGIGTTNPSSALHVKGGIFSNGSYEESIAGGSTIDKTVTFAQRGMFMMLISFSLGTTSSDSTRNIYSFGLFTPTSNNAVWTAINEDLVSSHVGTFTISGNSVTGQLRIQKTAGSDNRQCSFRIDVLSSTGVEITVADT